MKIANILALAEKYYKPKTLAHAIRVAGYVSAEAELLKYSVDPELLYMVAIAHDLLEDTKCTEEEILPLLGEYGLMAVRHLIHNKEEYTYEEYISKIMKLQNSYAILVKRADMKDHLMQMETLSDKLKDKYLPVVGMLL